MAVRPYTTRTSYATRETPVVGLEEAMRKLRALPEAIVGRNGGPVRSALMNALLPAFKEIKTRLESHPADIAHMAKDVRRQREKRPDILGLSEAINLGLKQQKELPMWWWYEWGTDDRATRKGAERGQISFGHSFFRAGFEMHRSELGPRFALALKKRADREAKKLARSGGPMRVPR